MSPRPAGRTIGAEDESAVSADSAGPAAAAVLGIDDGGHDQQPLLVSYGRGDALMPHGTEEVPTSAGSSAEPPLRDTSVGLWLMLMTGFFAATLGLGVKVATRMGVSSLMVVLIRSLVQLTAALAVSACLRICPWGGRSQMPWMAAWGVLASVATTIYYYALSVIDLGNATTLWFTMPIWIALLAHVFLGERITHTVAAASLSSLVGVVLVTQPAVIFGQHFSETGAGRPKAGHAGLGAACALLGALLMACAQIIVRRTSCKTHWINSVFWMSAISMSIALLGIFLQATALPTEPTAWCLLLAIGIAAFLLDCCLVVGLRLAPAGPGAIMRNLDVVISYIYQVNLLHAPASAFSICGASVITLSTVAIGLDRWYTKRKSARPA